MKILAQKISQSIVKPSIPTPNPLRRCQFSYLDQVMVGIFSSWFLFYPGKSNITNAERCQRLKKSLSETLNLFYPFAGRIVGNSYIDCNDEGVPFVESKVEGNFLEVHQNPYCNELNKLLPFKVSHSSDLVAFVQVNYFDCGGMVIGVGLSHKIADGSSIVKFLNTWAAVARGDSNISVPRFDAAKYFAPIIVSDFDPDFEVGKGLDDVVSRRYLFNESSLEILRNRYAENGTTGDVHGRPTRSEALTAFILEKFIAATKAKANPDTVYVARHAVNIRPMMDPCLSDDHIGNIIYEQVVAELDVRAKDACSYRIIEEMRRKMKSGIAEFVKKIGADGEWYLKLMKERAEVISKGTEIPLDFSSGFKFPFYQTDFGWDKPRWIGTGVWPTDNLVIFLPAKERGGIEVYLNLGKQDLEWFEDDNEIASLVSPLPILLPSSL